MGACLLQPQPCERQQQRNHARAEDLRAGPVRHRRRPHAQRQLVPRPGFLVHGVQRGHRPHGHGEADLERHGEFGYAVGHRFRHGHRSHVRGQHQHEHSVPGHLRHRHREVPAPDRAEAGRCVAFPSAAVRQAGGQPRAEPGGPHGR